MLVPAYPSMGVLADLRTSHIDMGSEQPLIDRLFPSLSLKHETCGQTGSSGASKSRRFQKARADNMRREFRDRRAEESPR